MMQPLLDGFAARARTSDGLAAHRSPMPFADATPVAIDEQEAAHGHPRDLSATLLTRRSSLHYADAPVRTDLVLSLLQHALRRDSDGWELDDDAGPLEAFVFALRSEGKPAGVYRVTARELSFIAPTSVVGDPELLGVQREFADAGGIVSLYANIDRADSWAGSHGYRLCAVRASMALYDFHLRCQSHGLVGTMFGGFIGSAVRNLVQSDGVTRHPLLAATYAHPAP
ncbi:tpaF [Streptomyces coeruleofuscus]